MPPVAPESTLPEHLQTLIKKQVAAYTASLTAEDSEPAAIKAEAFEWRKTYKSSKEYTLAQRQDYQTGTEITDEITNVNNLLLKEGFDGIADGKSYGRAVSDAATSFINSTKFTQAFTPDDQGKIDDKKTTAQQAQQALEEAKRRIELERQIVIKKEAVAAYELHTQWIDNLLTVPERQRMLQMAALKELQGKHNHALYSAKVKGIPKNVKWSEDVPGALVADIPFTNYADSKINRNIQQHGHYYIKPGIHYIKVTPSNDGSGKTTFQFQAGTSYEDKYAAYEAETLRFLAQGKTRFFLGEVNPPKCRHDLAVLIKTYNPKAEIFVRREFERDDSGKPKRDANNKPIEKPPIPFSNDPDGGLDMAAINMEANKKTAAAIDSFAKATQAPIDTTGMGKQELKAAQERARFSPQSKLNPADATRLRQDRQDIQEEIDKLNAQITQLEQQQAQAPSNQHNAGQPGGGIGLGPASGENPGPAGPNLNDGPGTPPPPSGSNPGGGQASRNVPDPGNPPANDLAAALQNLMRSSANPESSALPSGAREQFGENTAAKARQHQPTGTPSLKDSMLSTASQSQSGATTESDNNTATEDPVDQDLKRRLDALRGKGPGSR